MKDWRGVPLREGDQVLWVHHAGNHWWPRVGNVVRFNNAGSVVVKRELTESEKSRQWYKPSGISTLPAERLTRVDILPPAGDDVSPPYE